MANQDKTEQATPRKKQKAREKGQVPRSRDLISTLALGAAVLLLAACASSFGAQWKGLLRRSLDTAANGGLPGRALWPSGAALAGTVALVLGLSWLAAAAGALAQGGLVLAPAALQPNVSRLSPATRLEQLFSLPALGRLLKSILPGTGILYLAAGVLARDWNGVLHLSNRRVPGIFFYGGARIFEVGWKCSLMLLLWSGADYLIEHRKLANDLRMSRQDLLDEYKETEGHPTVKARIRRLRRQVQRRRMLADVQRAAVVITNPNEFAVALEYGPQLLAPTVVAKGRNLLAQQIKQEARWHGIPLVENPPLAHALYRAAAVGQSIPPKLYAVVAAVLAAIYRAQERAQRRTGT